MSTVFHLDMDFNQLKSWIGHVSQAIVVVNESGMVVATNRPFQRLIQYSVDEIEGRVFVQFLHLPVSLQTLRKKAGWVRGELQAKAKEIVQVDIHIMRKTYTGKGYFVFTCFPTADHQMKIHQLMTSLPIGMMTLSQKQQMILEVNPVACAFFDLKKEDILYQPIKQVLSNQKDLGKLFSFLLDPKSHHHKCEITWNEKYLSLTACHVSEEIESVAGYRFFIEDITKMRSLEQQLKYNNRLATIGQIAAGSAHEIRNPLTSIKGFLQVISSKMEVLGHQKEQSYINLMLKEINRINHLVGELLLLSKPKEMDMSSVEIAQVFKEILPIIKNEALLHNIRIQLEYQTSRNIEVLADGKLLKQVFLNICKNAIEAMDHGGCLAIRLMHHKKKKLVVEFEDTGSGIPDEVRKNIFKPFFTTKDNGTGLGLPICQQIMQEIGGRISVDSTEKGTLFRLLLPLP